MKVAMVKPPSVGSSVRGIGYYAERLLFSLKNLPDLEISWLTFSKNPFVYQKYDIVHFPYFDFFQLTLPPLRISRTLVTVHDMIPFKFPDHFPMGKKAKAIWPIQKKILSGVDGIITDSYSSKKDIEQILKFPNDKIFVTHLAADEAFRPITDERFLKNIKQKYSLPDKFIFYVGGVNWNKNIPALIKATEGDLVLVGKEFTNDSVNLNHPELSSFKEILSLIKDNPRVKRLGFVDTKDLAAIYNLATVYVQPSIYEGFGLPLLEAMASGIPAISGPGGSLSEVGGKGVIYSNTENISDLKKKISTVLSSSKANRDKLGERALQESRRFSWEKTAEQTFEVYSQILSSL